MKVVKENSSFRLRWDVLTLILIVVSFLVIPFQLTFEHKVTLEGSVIIYAIDLFFMLSIFINANTSIRTGGQTYLNPELIKTRYYRKDLKYDLLAAFPLEVVFLLIPDFGFLGISLVLWVRLIRLIRIRQLFIIFRRWQRHYSINPGYIRIGKFLSVILLLSHLISCCWYFSAFVSGFPKDSWAVRQGVYNSDVVTQYIRSIYWTVTTMTTVGYGDITPHLNYEYVFVLVVMIIGASTYAFLIGNIASLISSLDSVKSKYWNDIEALNLYLNQRKVSNNIINKVHDFFEYRWEYHKGLNEENILSSLPRPLRLELMQDLAKDLLSQIPIFKHCSSQLKEVLVLGLKSETYNPDCYISRTGDIGNNIVFLTKGIIEVVDEESGDVFCEFKAGDYFGNLSIMLQERRTAAVRTKSFCEAFILDTPTFFSIKKDFPEFIEVMKKTSAEKSEKTNLLLMKGIII